MSPAEKYEWTGAGGRQHWVVLGLDGNGKPWAIDWDEDATLPVFGDEILRLAARVKELEAELKEKEEAEWDRYLEGKEEYPE
jgi:hypothetical protein